MIGRIVSHYQILEEIGAGGMGIVYKAQDTKLKRTVALKFLPPELARDETAKKRLLQEAQAVSTLQHHNICTVHEIDETDDGRLFICMDYYEGETLKDRLARGPLSVEEAIDITVQIARGLENAHRRGIVHRDVKPANVMVTTDGVAKILDFGLAKLAGQANVTRTGSTVGTVAYMSPEQVRGEELDARSDIFSLGVTFYELLTATTPFAAEYEPAIMHKILNVAPPSLRNSGVKHAARIEQAIGKMLAKEATERFSAAREVIEELSRVLANAPDDGRTRGPKRRLPARRQIVVTVVAVSVVAAGAWLFGQRRGTDQNVGDIRSIAVLPFVNMSGDDNQEYFSDGVSEELINVLVKIPDLKVSGRTSSFSFKGKNEDLRTIGEKLGVAHILEGSVRKSGGSIRITAQLVKAADGFNLWSQTYDRTLEDIFAVQDDIARSVAREIKIALFSEKSTSGEAAQDSAFQAQLLVTRSTSDLQAYELYLKGRQASQRWTRSGVDNAIEYFRGAIERDPAFTQAHAGLADVYSIMDHRAGLTSLGPAETYRLAEEAASEALKLDPNSAEGHAALGHIQSHRGEFREAEEHLRRAVELNPNAAMSRVWYGVLLRVTGRNVQSKEQFSRARELEPLSSFVSQLGSFSLWAMGDFATAIDFAEQGLRAAPEYCELYLILARAYACAGRIPEAEEQLRRAETARETAPFLEEERAMFLGIAGRKPEALALLRSIERDKKVPQASAMVRAYAACGELDLAIEWLDVLVERNPYYARLNIDYPPHPAFAGFIADPRLQEVRKGFGLPPLRPSS